MGDIALCPTPAEIITVLGSCVSVCLWDSRLFIGGMNHFRAPIAPPHLKQSNAYGDNSIRTLIQGMLELGSRKRDLSAIILGGGSVIEEIEIHLNIGRDNIRFAEEFLDREGIIIRSSHTGRDFGRKIAFNTLKGTATIRRVRSLRNISGKKKSQG